MQRILLCAALALTLCACQPDALAPTADVTENGSPDATLSRADINTLVEEHLFATNEVYDWNEASDEVVWSALAHSNHEAAIGYQPVGYTDLAGTIHEVDVNAGDWATVRAALKNDLLAATRRLTGRDLTAADLFYVGDEEVLPHVELKILHPGIVSEFRNRPDVRYLEPTNYKGGEIDLRSGSGCSEAPSNTITSGDFSTIAPGAKQPWNYGYMNIPQAWNTTRGAGVGIAIIDTGVYPEQDNLGSQFNANYSNVGRSIGKYGTYAPNWWSSRTDGPNDRCGHGTQMSGLAAGPRTSQGSTVGVAYQANLRSYRATSDVIINGSREKRGVKDALVSAGNHSGTKVISMSIGDVFSSGTVKDGVRYANNRGKMILAAAGTSLSWTSWYGVIFPASMSETVAVTGIRTGSPMQRCNTCHDGSAVDFVAVMQRRNDTDRTSLTLSRYNDNPGYVGGSSAATATTAGIAALVWSTNPGQSKTQVLNRMKQAASIYPGRSGSFGWGMIDAAAAVQ